MWIAAIIIISIIILIAIKAKKNKVIEINVKERPLLSKNETAFFMELKKNIPENKYLTCKCRLEDLITIEKNTPKRQAQRNKIKSRHIDFVVFDPEKGKTEFAIELDDSSHKNKKIEDEFKNKVFKKVNIPLIRIKAKKKYNAYEIKEEIEKNF